MVDQKRRHFFKKYLLQEFRNVARGFGSGLKEAEENSSFDAFFDSYESSYALTLAYPDEILMETARQHGIETQGREKKEIAKELFKKHGGYGN